MKTSTHQDTIKNLIPALSEKEKQEIQAYFAVYEKYSEEFSAKATEDLKNHPVFGKIIRDIPKEVSEANNKVSKALQKDAIQNDNWQPFIEYQIGQGIIYAKMGLNFKSWYEVISLVRNFLLPYLKKAYGSGDEFLSAVNGMNNFMDIAMGIIGEAYMQEKKEIIRQANERLTSIFETTADIIFVLEVESNERYRFSSVNRSFQTIMGIPNEAVVDKYLHDITPPQLLNHVLGKYKEAIEGKKIVRWEQTIHYPTGFLIGEVSAAPTFDEAGKCIRLVAAVHDITERKNAEETLRINEAKLKQAQAIAHLGSWELDFTTQIATWSEEACRIYGLSPEDNKQTFESWLSYAHPDDLEHVKREVEKSNTFLSDTVLNHRIIRKDGVIRHIHSVSKFILNLENKPIGLYGISYDVTGQKIAEEEIKKLNEELEQKVIERTAELETANKELEAFSYSISHDLRAPLRAVNGYAQMLNEDYGTKLDEEGKRIIETIRYNAIKMATLIDDLLSFSKLGRKGVQRTRINMKELIESAIEDLAKSYTHKAEIKIGKLHHVEADYSLMYQVMVNLISNAIKYSSKKNNPLVEIFSEEKNGEAVFSVRDNGVGFDMRYYDKLFGVFQRLHKQNEFDGVGVGLAIVQRIIDKHGGKVWAEGKVNEGAQFNFSLTIN